jgi:DNA-binding transcriptional LysR family regulator
MLEQLELGRLDVVVGRLDNYHPRSALRSERLYNEPLNVVARPGHPLEKRKNLNWDDLYEYEWIVWPYGTPIRSKLDNALTSAGRAEPPYRVESTSHMGNLWLLQCSDMLSVVSERVARYCTGRGLVVPLDMKIESAEGFVGMCWKEADEQDSGMQDLLDCFRKSS